MTDNVFRYLLAPETAVDNIISATYTVGATGKTVQVESNTAVSSQAYVTLPGPGTYSVTARYKTDCGEVSLLSATINNTVPASICIPPQKISAIPSLTNPLEYQLSLVGEPGNTINYQWKVKNGYGQFFSVNALGAGQYSLILPSADLYSVTLTFQTICGEIRSLNTVLVADLMQHIPGGRFMMGSGPNEGDVLEGPLHPVKVDGFYLGKTEVTVAQFNLFIEDTNYTTDAERQTWTYFMQALYSQGVVYLGETQKKSLKWNYSVQGIPLRTENYDYPVIYITWNDCIAFCQWLSQKTGEVYRLPYEAEWEYAAGNGEAHTKYSWGNFDLSNTNKMANVGDESLAGFFSITFGSRYNQGYNDEFPTLAPVGSFKPNNLGLYDMTGNVSEWCGDGLRTYTNDFIANPIGPSAYNFFAIKGGNWESVQLNMRIAVRSGQAPNISNNRVGFRMCKY